MEEIENTFKNATQLLKCFVNLNSRKTKIREEDRFLFPKDIIDLIPNLQKCNVTPSIKQTNKIVT